MSEPIIGVDLGTTNSCCAIADAEGNVTLVPYRGGELTIPSVYAIDDKGNELVGYDAKRQWQLNPTGTVYGSKRLIGTAFESDLVRHMREQVAYDIQPGPKGECVIAIADRLQQLPEISAKILSKVRDVASAYLKTAVSKAVVTVPAYYNDRQRQAVRLAGELAGLSIVRIINEPTAAAIAFGARDSKNQTVAVYDLGGGTFDISVIEIRNNVFEVKATGGDIFLGGIDFDNALIEYVLSDFSAAHQIDLSQDPVAMQRIRDMAERVKIDLSVRTESPLNIPFITMTPEGQPLDLGVVIRRDDIEMLVEHLAERTFVTCGDVLTNAGVDPEQIDEVILVGGQTRMPLIQKRIQGFFGRSPSKRVHPDEAVAIGAALFAGSLSDRSATKFQLLDVLPMAIGIERAGGTMYRLFERNCAIPNRRQFTFTTHRDQQKDLAMRIYQGDDESAASNELLGELVVTGIRAGPAGSVRVEVVFDVNNEGILTLAARDLDTGAAMHKTMRFEQS